MDIQAIRKDYPMLHRELCEEIRKVLMEARARSLTAVNTAMVAAYWNIGRLIVEAQGGNEKSTYGSSLINNISHLLVSEFGKGFTPANLRYMRQFFLTFPNCHSLSDNLTWTHYRHLVKVHSPQAREYYMQEASKGQWSVRQLQRQIHTMTFERLISNQNECGKTKQATDTDNEGISPATIIRDPYVLEFLDLKADPGFYEKDVEDSLIAHLKEFLLELGRGFSFVARQKRITFDGRHFYIDLVFYNYIAKCFVLIDLKTGDLTHQDLGQMQMYVNYYNSELRVEGDNPAIGILLCADKSEEIVRYTLGDSSANVIAAKYLSYLPTEEELKRELRMSYDNFIALKA